MSVSKCINLQSIYINVCINYGDLQYFAASWSMKIPNANLLRRSWKDRWPSSLVKISISWDWDGTYMREIRFAWNSSRTKWQSTSMCFVRLWKTGLVVICMVPWVSQCRWTRRGWEIPRSRSNCQSHLSSQHVTAIDRYSASAEERKIVDYFLVLQEIGELFKHIM